MPYAELHMHSAFTFLEGASLPEQLAERAADLGYEAIALTDRDDLGGHVRFLEAADKVGVQPIVGAEVSVRSTPLFDGARSGMRMGADVFGLVLLAKDAAGYSNLAALVSKGRFERPRGRPYVTIEEVAARSQGLVALTAFLDGPLAPALRTGDADDAVRLASPWIEIFGDDLFLEVQDHALPEERRAIRTTLEVARALELCEGQVMATNHVHHVTRAVKPVEDVLRCVKHQCTVDDAGDRLFPNDERFLKSPREMLRRFRTRPELVHATVAVAERCAFRLKDLQAPLPCFPVLFEGETADQTLVRLAWDGAKIRYPALSPKHRAQLDHELEVIAKMRFAGYFLILWDIVRAAKKLNILVQGRGSAANSAVCYCLGITAVDPIGRDLLFERFLSEGRAEPPDIDLDIEHERREELLQYVYEKYGRDHAAMVAAVHTYQPRAAARDVARVLGLSPQQGASLASLCDRFVGMDMWGGSHRTGMAAPLPAQEGMDLRRGPTDPTKARDDVELRMSPDKLRDAEALRAAGLDPDDKRVAMVPWLVDRMVGLPRHRAIHSGGFVLSERPIFEVCPVEWASMPGRTIVQWEKDDLSTLGLVKFDLLGLGMLTMLHGHLELIAKHRGQKLDLWELPHDDPEVYDMICEADTVGLFQIESRAQMNTLPRLRPRQFYDLVVEVALIRPGPIQGEMVHPYLRRRRGEEPITFLHPSLEPHLARTLGVPLFQEQGMKVAIEVGGFSPAEADGLRRAMGHKRSRAAMVEIGDKLQSRFVERGIGKEIAERIIKQLTAFADYGFPESHAASFALLVYASAYLKYHFTPEFYAAILNAQPMGFYSPSSLVEDAKRHGVTVLAPDVSYSEWDCTLEPTILGEHPFAMRVGLRYVRGLGERTRPQIEQAIAPRPRSIRDFVHRAGDLSEAQLVSMASAGAFESLEGERRRAVWEILRLAKGAAGPLDLPGMERHPPPLPQQSEPEVVAADFARIGLTPREHPMGFLRGELDARGVVTARALPKCGRRQVRVAGLVICRQRPATAKGFVFLTLEDEGGMVNVIVEPKVFEEQRRTIVQNTALEIDGEITREQGVINVKAKLVRPLSLPWADGTRSHDFH